MGLREVDPGREHAVAQAASQEGRLRCRGQVQDGLVEAPGDQGPHAKGSVQRGQPSTIAHPGGVGAQRPALGLEANVIPLQGGQLDGEGGHAQLGPVGAQHLRQRTTAGEQFLCRRPVADGAGPPGPDPVQAGEHGGGWLGALDRHEESVGRLP